MPVAIPAGVMDAVPESEEAHCAEAVRSFELPSEYMPVALKETWAETDTDVELGVTETLAKVAEPPVPPVPVDESAAASGEKQEK